MKWYMLLILLIPTSHAFTQNTGLEALGLDMALPAEDQFKTGHQKILFDQHIHRHLVRKKDDIEIFCWTQKLDEEKHHIPPQAAAFTMISHLASNEPESVVAVHQMAQLDLDTLYHASWGATAYFRPKEYYTTYPQAKLIAIHQGRKGHGLSTLLIQKAKRLAPMAGRLIEIHQIP